MENEKIIINLNLEIEAGENPETPDEDIAVRIDFEGIANEITTQLIESLIKPEHHQEVISKINDGSFIK